MEEAGSGQLIRELKLKRFQFNSIYEFSSTLYSSFNIDHIIRVFFSTIMGQMGVSRIFIHDKKNGIFHKRGFSLGETGEAFFSSVLGSLSGIDEIRNVDEMEFSSEEIREQFRQFRIHYLVPVESGGGTAIMGLGLRFNRDLLSEDDLDLAFFISRFAMIAIHNALMVNRLIESQRIAHEIKIAHDIQHSLLPQSIPKLKRFELCVEYRPIHEVGGDYYDILKTRGGRYPVLIADVEGKGLPAALLAASSQAVFHSVNDLFQSTPAESVAKSNSLIHEFTRGQRFITVFWMLVDDVNQQVTTVNAGHEPPFTVDTNGGVKRLNRGGFLTGFLPEAVYEQETFRLEPGEWLVAFTDGVVEVENAEGEEFGRERLENFVIERRSLSAGQLKNKLVSAIEAFSGGRSYRDDFTLMILKGR